MINKRYIVTTDGGDVPNSKAQIEQYLYNRFGGERGKNLMELLAKGETLALDDRNIFKIK